MTVSTSSTGVTGGLLQDRVAVVAGYGPGLGAALASRSAAHGARVVIASRTQSKLDAAAEELAAVGATVLPPATDVNDEAASQQLLDATLHEFGRVDVLFSNAFRMPPM